VAATPAREWADSAQRSLSDAGHRAGGARRAVVELLAEQKCCVSAQEISDKLCRSESKVGLASVYRALDVLHGLALVQRVDLGDGELRFEPIRPGGEHHHHAVCRACGRVTPFHDERLEADLERIAQRAGHSLDAHEVVIHGLCGRCDTGTG
jgi:Fur family transcriptional regulator, ferric uptake regulator